MRLNFQNIMVGQTWVTKDGDRLTVVRLGGPNRPRVQVDVIQPDGKWYSRVIRLSGGHFPFRAHLQPEPGQVIL